MSDKSPRATHTPRAALGKAGEEIAQGLLERSRYRIVDTNVRFGRAAGIIGEIDIIAWDGDILCFIEVKTRQSNQPSFSAAQSVTPAKQRQIARLALVYANQVGLLTDDAAVPFRFDVVSVVFSAQPDLAEKPRTELIRGAFLAPDDFDG